MGIKCGLEIVEPAKRAQYVQTSWNNALLLDNQSTLANSSVMNPFYFGEPTSNYRVTRHPDNWNKIINDAWDSVVPEKKLEIAVEDGLYNDETVIPLYFYDALFAVTNKVRDSGLGLLGRYYYPTAENIWLSK